LALDAGLLLGTNLVTRPLLADEPARKIGLVWRQGTGRRDEFRLLATELSERAKVIRKSARGNGTARLL
jgi:LysR family transcriptional regulator, hydrogen peroxide-inducible genes activator